MAVFAYMMIVTSSSLRIVRDFEVVFLPKSSRLFLVFGHSISFAWC